MNSCDFERTIGIETFLTKNKGIGGKLRTIPEDFIVHELYRYPLESNEGLYSIAEVSSKNWETHTLVRELAKRLRISRKRISFAGTKDKRAHSTQLMSFYDVSKDLLSQLKIKDVEVTNIYKADTPVRIGDLYGNRFTITIRNIDKNIQKRNIIPMLDCLKEYSGFPNFFGVQRFGMIRPINHLIGRSLIDGDYETAVMTYLARPFPGETQELYNLRKELESTRNFARALQVFPDHLIFEKSILNSLVHASLSDIQFYDKTEITNVELGANELYRLLLRDLPESAKEWKNAFTLYLVGEKMSAIVFHCCEAGKKIYAARFASIGLKEQD